MNKMKVALATALKFPNWHLCRLCLVMLVLASSWQGSHAAYMYVKGTASPYYKIGDGSFNQMTNHFNTSDGTIWYYANVDNGSTVTFASSSDGANASPAIPFDSSNDSYFYFGEGIGINLTSQKTSTSCFYFSAGSWWTNDNAVFRCHMWNSNTSTTWPGVEGTVVGGNSNTTIYAFEQSFTPTGIKFTRLTLDNDQLVVQNETSNIENTDLSNGEYYIVNAANNYPYDSKIDTYIVTAWPNRDIFTGELYLIGQANENSWQPNVGIKMTAMNSAKTHFKANNVHFKPSNDGFAFATQLSNDWTTLNAHRLGSNGDGNRWTITENLLNQWNNNLQVDYNYEKNFVVDVEGDYDVEVNLETMQVKVSQVSDNLSFTGNFYGPGFYRAFNGQSGKNLDVVSNIGNIQMTAINMADNNHFLHSDAGSILHVDFLDEASLQIGMPYGLYNIEAQGAGTQVITSQMMGLFNELLSSHLGSSYPLPFVPVNVNPARTEGELQLVANGENGSLYQASFNMAGLTALFRDNHGVAQTAIGDNFGLAMDATHASADFQRLAAQYFPPYDVWCNWYLTPVDGDENYYTPPYNNANSDGYINVDGMNWATVYVDFPFMLPEGATAYLINEDGEKVALNWEFIPDNVPVLISWIGDGTNDVKLVPGMYTLTNQDIANFNQQIGPWLNYSFDQIYVMVTTDYTNAVSTYGQDAIDYIYDIGINMIDEIVTDEELKNSLKSKEKDEFFAAISVLVADMLKVTVENGISTEAMMAANIRQLIVNGIRNKFFYDKYNAAFGQRTADAKALAETYREEAKINSLSWCGDFFGYDPEHSSNAAQVIPFDGYSMLSGAVNGEPEFDDPVTEWNGNMAYLDQLSHTLQWIVEPGNGVDNGKYRIKDELQVAYAYRYDGEDVVIFAKDNNNCADNYRSVKPQNANDYMANQYFNSAETNTGLYDDQSNWIEIHMPFDDNNTDPASLQNIAYEYWDEGAGVEHVLSQKILLTNVQGTYIINNGNPILNVTSYNSKVSEDDINVNTFIPANFYESEVQQGCFFVRPKTLEVAFFDWGIWNSTKSAFVIPKKSEDGTINGFGLHGGFNVNLTYAEINSNSFNDGYAYRFYGVVRKKSNSKRANAFEYNQDEPLNGDYEVWPFYINNVQGIITSVANVKVERQVASVEYVNLAGQRSSKPWQGVNIVVTRYTDGTTRSTKAIM